MAFVHPSVYPLSIRLFPLCLWNRLTFNLDLLYVCGSLPWLVGIETEDQCQGQG